MKRKHRQAQAFFGSHACHALWVAALTWALALAFPASVHGDFGGQLFHFTSNEFPWDTTYSFGADAANDGNIALVSAWHRGFNSGRVFSFDLTTGEQISVFNAADQLTARQVDLSGNVGIVDGKESVFLFDVVSGEPLHSLKPADVSISYPDYAVAIDGNRALVGERIEAGAAYVFDVTRGEELAKLSVWFAPAADSFGADVDLSGDTAIVGAPEDKHGCPTGDFECRTGAAYLFDVSTGQKLAKLTPDDPSRHKRFGGAVAIDGDLAIIGATGDPHAGPDSGAAYVFDVTTGRQLYKRLFRRIRG